MEPEPLKYVGYPRAKGILSSGEYDETLERLLILPMESAIRREFRKLGINSIWTRNVDKMLDEAIENRRRELAINPPAPEVLYSSEPPRMPP